MTIAYQGIKGAYSYIASKYLFPDAKLLGKGDFEGVFGLLVSGQAEALVLPIENSLIGSIFEVYDLLFAHEEIQISGEVTLEIDHNLLVHPEVENLSQIKEVYSHRKALDQCKKIVAEIGAKAVIWEDTAGAAAYVALKQDASIAAIASATAGEVYGLKVLKSKVQDNQANQTRFVVVARNQKKEVRSEEAVESRKGTHGLWKTSLEFVAAHQPGSLLECLQPFAQAKLNLTKIESRPLVGSPWQYLFYLDFEHQQLHGELEAILAEIKPHTQVLRHLGTYPKGQTIHEVVEGGEVEVRERTVG